MPKKSPRLTKIPDGCAAITESGKMYYASGGDLLEIPSTSIFDSWSFPTVFACPQVLADAQSSGKRLGFRPGSVVGSITDSCFYYIGQDGKRHKITDPAFFKQSGRSRWSVDLVSKKDLEFHKEGEDIE